MQLQQFDFKGNDVRTINHNGEVYFVAKDICKSLEIKNTTQAMAKLNDNERTMLNIGRAGETNVVTESGMYALVLTSRKKEAKIFREWITSKVLPSIRKTGMYVTESKVDEILKDPQAFIKLLEGYAEQKEMNQKLTATIHIQDQVIEEQKKKTDYLDTILKSKDALNVQQIAADYNMSAQTLNKFLKEKGVQFSSNGQWILTTKYRGKGYTKSETYWYQDSDDKWQLKMSTKWLQKGRLFIHELLLAEGIYAQMDIESC